MKMVHVDGLGDCTLLSLSVLPAEKGSYKNLLASAQLMGLKEIPIEFTAQNLKTVVDAVANFVGCDDTLWVSGTVKSVSVYNKAYTDFSEGLEIPEEDCVIWIDFLLIMPGEVTTSIMHIGIEECFGPDHVHCLFLGKVD